MTVIFALFAFGHLFGFVGVLIALPASALIAVGDGAAAGELHAEQPLQRMKQIPLAIGPEPARTFENFLPGANGEALAHLLALAPGAPPVYLWGPAGSGKTHLLHALVERAAAHGPAGGLVLGDDAGAVERGRRSRLARRRRRARARRRPAAGRVRALRRRDDARRRHRRRRQRAAGRPRRARGPAHPPRLGPCLRARAARRGRGARGASARGRPPRHLSLRRGDGLPADALRARPEAPDGAARPARRVLAREQARDHGAAAEADARGGGRARESGALRPRPDAAADRFRPRLGRVHDRARLGRRGKRSAPATTPSMPTTAPADSTSTPTSPSPPRRLRERGAAELAAGRERFMREVDRAGAAARSARAGRVAPPSAATGSRSSPRPTTSSPRRSPPPSASTTLIATRLERDADGAPTGPDRRRRRRFARARSRVSDNGWRRAASAGRTSSASASTAIRSTTWRCSRRRPTRSRPILRPSSKPSPASAAGAS